MMASMNERHDVSLFMAALAGRNGSSGHISLRRELGWARWRYGEVVRALEKAGVVTRGGGQGGSVSQTGAQVPADLELDPTSEKDIYDDVAEVLERSWAPAWHLDDQFAAFVYADGGRGTTGGRWTRPDLVGVWARRLPLLDSFAVDVHSFEVEISRGFDIASVYEALGHRRRATHSWVWAHAPRADADEAPLDADVAGIARQAAKNGIGLIVGSDPADFSTWSVLVQATRTSPDLVDVERLLRDVPDVAPFLEARRNDRTWIRPVQED
jgi:hypothetical protein